MSLYKSINSPLIICQEVLATIILKVLIYLPSKILLSQTAQTTSTWKPNEGVLVIEVVKILKRTKPKHRNRDLRRCPFCSITMWIPETPTFSLCLSLSRQNSSMYFSIRVWEYQNWTNPINWKDVLTNLVQNFIIFFRLLLVAKTKYQQTHIFFNHYFLVSTSSPDQEPKALSQPLKTQT